VTTITTVGYGDISGSTDIEKVFCIFIMIIGVLAFSFATGSLASILANYDV
jgi:Trk-type K+ transport system membrane component